jgi:hypothetical protein
VNENERQEKLFEEVGPFLGEARIDHYPNAKLWRVIISDKAEIFVEPDEARGCLVFASNLATPPADKAANLYEFLMRVNNLWQDTGGLRFALEEPGGDALILRDQPTEPLRHATELANALLDFAERTHFWRQVAETGGPTEDAETSQPSESSEAMIHI